MPSLEYTAILCAWIAGLLTAGIVLMRVRRTRRRAGRSLRLVHALLASVLALAALTLPEVVFALGYDATDSFSQTNVSRRWFERYVHANRAGFRDDNELPRVREPGVTTIGFVGDSFTFGHGIRRVEDRFSDVVARGLEHKFPHRTRVFNAALQGLDIRGLTNELAPELIKSTPLDVLVYVFVPNDIEYLDERTARFYAAQQSSAPRFFLWRNTYFYN